jgi:hypothetical protein
MSSPTPGLDSLPLDPRFAFGDLSSVTGARIRCGSFSRSALTGELAVTGVGFRPRAVWVMSRFDSSVSYAHSLVFAGDDGTWGLSQSSAGSIDPSAHLVSLTAGSSAVRAALQSLDPDGFTLSYAHADSPSSSYYLCIG